MVWLIIFPNSVFIVVFSLFIGSNTVHGEVCSIQHNVIKLVSVLQQIGGFLRIIQLTPIQLTATI